MTTEGDAEAVTDMATDLVREFSSGRFQALGSDPCAQEMQLREWDAEVYRRGVTQVAGTAAAISEQLQRAIAVSINTLGHSGQTGTPLEVWLNNNIGLGNLTPTAEEAGIATIGILTGGVGLSIAIPAALGRVRNRLPSAAKIRAGNVSSEEKGLQVGPGVYLWAPGVASNPTTPAQQRKARETGKLQGPAIADAINGWIQHQIDRVTPADFASARNRLARLVGSAEGSGEFGIWQQGDPVTATSKLGQLEAIRGEVRARREELDERCEAEKAEASRLISEQQAADIEFRRLALWSGAGLGIFVVIAWARSR